MDRPPRRPWAVLVALAILSCGSPVITGPSPAASPSTSSRPVASESSDPGPSIQPSLPVLGGTWTKGPPLPQPLGEVAGAVLDGKLYVAGGFGLNRQQSAGFLAFDPKTNTWTQLADLPEPRDHAALTALGGRLFLTGGNGPALAPRANLWIYSRAANGWSAGPPMPERRSAHAAVEMRGYLFILGGVIAGRPLTDPTWRYDPVSGVWDTALAPPPTYREHVAAVVIHDGSILLIGGRAARDLGAVERYDPVTEQWTSLAPLPTPRGGLAAANIDDALHVIGGESIESPRVFAEHDVLDLASGDHAWAIAPPLERGRHGLASGVIDGRWYLAAGGEHPDLAVSDRLDIFTP